MSGRRGARVSLVGATGLVGRELLRLLEAKRFPVSRLDLFASGKTKASLPFLGKKIPVFPVDSRTLAAADLVFFAGSDSVSRRLAPDLAKRGVWVIDDSAAFRMDPCVPLIIPEVNADQLKSDRRLIAGPNCTMTGLAVAARRLHQEAGIAEIRVSSYQAVSGAGRAALLDFFGETRKSMSALTLKSGRVPILKKSRPGALPAPIFANVFPQVGLFGADGYSGEENKVAEELRKVWSAPNLRVSATAVRVPTLRGHCLSAWLTLKKPLAIKRAEKLVSSCASFQKGGRYPTPMDCAGKEGVFAARLRQGCGPREIVLWIAMDNLLKGAALNSLQIAFELLKRGWV